MGLLQNSSQAQYIVYQKEMVTYIVLETIFATVLFLLKVNKIFANIIVILYIL